MYMSLYSGLRSWAMSHSSTPHPSALKRCGVLMFEGFVPIDLIPADISNRLNVEIDRDGFAPVSEDLGIILLNECYERFGKMIPAI
jgi:hypothetical protein